MDTKKPRRASGKSAPEGLLAEIIRQPITETLEKNFMPYAMSVIVSRAIPEIDGFKPSHRKLLYTMYKMGLLTGARTKSANVVGQTMRLNPHGEGAIYETLVRLTRANESLLHPLIDSKGNFGKVYSRDIVCAASRYTEVRLAALCEELFRDIEHDTVDFSDNYDNTMREPDLLPTTFPNVLVSANQGIAVGMASQMCGFNLTEVCRAAIAYLRNPDCDLLDTMPAPDFPTGGEIIYDADAMRRIYETGRGSFKVRARWRYDKAENIIEITEIPYSTTLEAVLEAAAKLIRDGKLKEISDMRDETDKSGLKLAVDLRRGTDPDKLMQKLFKMTPLCDSFSCNFNILIAGSPRVMGVREILEEWCAWRVECLRRRTHFDLARLRERLHLLKGLAKILLDIDKAIRIIRETEEEAEVVPNLMIGFGIDEAQADYVADIRLRNINRQYILRRTEEISALESEIAELESVLADKLKIYALMVRQLESVAKKYGVPRRTLLAHDHAEYQPEQHIEDYPVHVFISREGYLKKITPQSLRMSGEHKNKDGDGPSRSFSASNKDEMLFLTQRQQCYKARLHEFDDTKASLLGDYLPGKLDFDDGEQVLFSVRPGDYSGSLLLFFANGKAARVELSAYATLSNRRKLQNAFSGVSPPVAAFHLTEETEMEVTASDGRVLVFHTAALAPKTTRSAQGVAVMSLKPRSRVTGVRPLSESGLGNLTRYRVRNIPAAGAPLRPEDAGEVQLTL
ncbi:MAG: DNA topoisomerase (ATP-hydrolyzing) subunit A [Oscillospiraceae bacterium]|nr:DNA topoisomerase (ATP-hydrolyzing) subunit A [Oscillospiraceae bacterium]